MNLTLKAAVAAAALAVAGAASAQAVTGASAATDLYLEVYDTTTLNTFILDLGVGPYTSAITTTQTFNLQAIAAAGLTATTSDWNAFITGNTAHTFDYFVVGGQTTAATTPGDASYVATSIPNGLAATSLNVLFGATSVGNTMFTSTATNAAIVAATDPASWASLVNPTGIPGTYLSNASGTPWAAATSAMDLVYYNGTANLKGSILGQIALNTTTGVLTISQIAAVPEPGTYALMAAGLLAVGAIVRRRSRS